MRIRIASLALLLASLQAARGDEGAVNARAAANNQAGFVAEKVYQFDGLDSVNLFNGNLTLTLPLGGVYPVGSNLSYGLRLHYNSKVWELIEGGQNACTVGQPESLAAFPARTLHFRVSAGLGWSFSLGHFWPRDVNSANDEDIYISPDGATHKFGAAQTLDPQIYPGYVAVSYSGDSAQLRLKKTVAGQYEIEFPDGSIHTFGSDGFILSMRDRFGNSVAISQAIVNGKLLWFLTDSHRTQTIRFTDAWNYLAPNNRFGTFRWVVESIDLAAFSPDGTSQIGRYEFEYDYRAVQRGCAAGYVFDPCSGSVEVPLLKTLRTPDGSTFQFQYNVTGSICDQGTLSRVTLPTGGAIGWTYGAYQLPANGCWNPFSGNDWRNSTVGVRTKTLYDANGAQTGQWTYQPALGPLITTDGVCDAVQPNGGGPEVPVTQSPTMMPPRRSPRGCWPSTRSSMTTRRTRPAPRRNTSSTPPRRTTTATAITGPR